MSKRLLFIHHSTGGNLIKQGNLRELMSSKLPSIELWDHGYNLHQKLPLPLLKMIANKFTFHTGLSDGSGEILGHDFGIKLGNDNPQDFEKIFCSNAKSNATLKSILEFDIIAFKNCYPTTRIYSDMRLSFYKDTYKRMGDCFEKYRNNIFVPFTPPPLRKEATQPKYAQRAKEFAKWVLLEWVAPQKVKVFDFFSLLADSDGYLRPEYCSKLWFDSHPNKHANLSIAPVFVEFLRGASTNEG